MSLGVLQPYIFPQSCSCCEIGPKHTHTRTRTSKHTHSLPLLTSCFVLCFQQDFKLAWMCYIRVCQNDGLWQQCGAQEAENIDCQQYWTLINLPTSSHSSTSLLHQLIQAWSDTWASGVSAAIKMPPLEHFNWNFCCWCVNSCRTEKGRSIMLALHRPPGVKWQQLLWQNTPPNAPVYLWFYCSGHPCTSSVSRLHGGCGTTEWEKKTEPDSVVADWDMLVKWNDQQGHIYRLHAGFTHSFHMDTHNDLHYTAVIPLLFLQTQIHYSFENDSFLPRGFWEVCGASSGEGCCF